MEAGKFITIEGVEGAGKSTCISTLKGLFEDAGHRVLVTREPGGTDLGEQVRALLLDAQTKNMDSVTELLLMFAARRQHVIEVIKPHLAKGWWVICDRFTDSSYAYQGGGRELPMAQIEALETLVLGKFEPDLTLLLDLDVATGLTRAAQVSTADRFEIEQQVFFERVRAVFLARADAHARFRVVDASRPLTEVMQNISTIVQEFVNG